MVRLSSLVPLLAPCVLLAHGCASIPMEDEAAELELGTGTSRFEALDDGMSVPLIRGAQGGWHVWLAVRTDDAAAALGSLQIELQPADESAPAQSSTVGIQLDPPDAQGRRSYLGWPAIIPDPSCAAGTMQRIRATFTTSAGDRTTVERFVMVDPGDSPPPPCAR